MNRQDSVVSVAIVNFNGGPLVAESIRAVLASTVPVEVLVSDNASRDGSNHLLRDQFGCDQRVHLHENSLNLGFAKACNLMLAKARGSHLLMLNPDALIWPDTLERLLKVLAGHPKAGMVGCLIRNPDGSEQAGCRRSVPTPWRSIARVLHLSRLFLRQKYTHDFVLAGQPLPSGPVPVDAISGAFMLVRRAVMQQVGGFDDAYFLHCEDLDWCMRVRQAGWQILFVPDVEIVHHKGTCSRQRPVFVEWHKHKGMCRFYRKFFQHRYPMVLAWLVMAGIWLRFGVVATRHSLVRAGHVLGLGRE